jgi:xylan 1,4-beta-xylosidase
MRNTMLNRRSIFLGGLILSFLSSAIAKAPAPSKSKTEKVRTITLDATAVKGPRLTVFKKCIGAGRANEGLRADWQAQLAETKKEIGFEMIRMHGLLHDDMGVYQEDSRGNPSYNFQYIDKLFDFLLSIGIRPFVELSFMPSALADWAHAGENTIFWWKGIIKPPKSYERWGALVTGLTRHVTERYGTAEVKQWYFEVWNEPNLPFFWAGSMDEYFKLYRTAAEAVRSVCSEYLVGGPSTAGNGWINETIEFCAGQRVPINFISTHDYGVREGYFDDTGSRGTVLDPDENAVKGNMIRSREKILASAMPNLELHYTEWSSSYTPTDPFHDTYQQAAYILDKVKGAEASVTSMSYWVFTDIFEESAVRSTPFHGGFGLMNLQGLKKPAYHAYRLMNRLGPAELQNPDPESWACTDAAGGVQALFWDFTTTPNPDSVNNQVFYKREMQAKPIRPVELLIRGMSEGTYALEVTRIGYRRNDVYTAYLDMGSPAQLTRPQEDALRAASGGPPEFRAIVKVKAGEPFTRAFPMAENDVVFLELTRL